MTIYQTFFYKYGVVLYNNVDVDSIVAKVSRRFKVGFRDDLTEFLANAYTSIVRNAGALDSTEHRVLMLLQLMRDYAWLSQWWYKQFIYTAYIENCKLHRLKCSEREARELLRLVIDLNLATDAMPDSVWCVRVTAPGVMLLNVYTMYRLGSLSDVESYARKIVEFPKKLLNYVSEKVSKVGEVLLSSIARSVIEDLTEYQEVLHFDALPIVANDIMQLLLLYQSDKVDQVALLGRQLVRWVEGT
ncbi:MAG: hypothetical protein LM568_00115 [Desulfurococcaceae archaeon]|nr:hypothetical protein [Desulfurococcaceae archaeon]